MYEVFSTRTGVVIAILPTRFLANWLCQHMDKLVFRFAYDYERKDSK